MISIIYLIMIFAFGISFTTIFIDTNFIYKSLIGKENSKHLPKHLLIIPFGIIIGIISVTIVNYYLIYIIYIINNNPNKSYYGLGIFLTFLIFITLTIINIKIIRKNYKKNSKKLNFKNNIMYLLVIFFITIISSFLMFYTYRIKDDTLLIGFSTYSDMSPHTAMTSSFGIGYNIPTSYRHFSGDGIKYHFLFYFFAGILQYLGLNIDYAINIPSIITMSCSLILISLLANLLSKNKYSFLIAPILVLFRSSFNFIYMIKDLIIQNNFPNGIINNDSWYSVTPYDNWGIWSINVYPNQRHLMLGIAAILIIIIIFIPYMKNGFLYLKNTNKKLKLKKWLFSKNMWLISKKDKFIIPALIITVFLPYFHGSALIAILLILFGMAIISEKRIAYLIIATNAIISSFIQTKIFSNGASNVVKFSFNPGFILDNINPINITKYIFIITGLLILISFLYSFTRKNNKLLYIYLTICFCLPLVFAFLFKITVEMLANHKFIQFSILLLDIIGACYIGEILKKCYKKPIKILILTFLIILLTGTGISEWFTFININKNDVTINYKAKSIKWIKKNTSPNDVFLTPLWASNSFFLSGRATYMGWPYYAWSAGYNTDLRGIKYNELLTGMNNDIESFTKYCKKHKIKYFIDSSDYLEYEDNNNYYNKDFFEKNLTIAASFKDENIKIYKIY